jgi:hypothetical protein
MRCNAFTGRREIVPFLLAVPQDLLVDELRSIALQMQRQHVCLRVKLGRQPKIQTCTCPTIRVSISETWESTSSFTFSSNSSALLDVKRDRVLGLPVRDLLPIDETGQLIYLQL